MDADVIDAAIAEARRRAAISDRDQSTAVAHFAGTVRAVCRGWRLTPEKWLGGGASVPTLAVTAADGTAGVLKIAERGSLDAAARVMVAAGGRGYVRVLAWDSERGALLTERLGHDLWAAEPTLGAQTDVVVPLLIEAWRVPLQHGRPFDGKAADLLRILAELGPRYGSAHPDAIARATEYATELAASERPEVVCHGDPHGGNVLRRNSGWALIDPDGFVGERAYDLGVTLRDACREIAAAESARPGAGRVLLRGHCRRICEQAGVDAERTWRWAYVERVTSGLYLRWYGYVAQAASFLDSAAILGG